MITEIVDPTSESSNAAAAAIAAATAAALQSLLAYAPQDPAAEISEGQKTLMGRFKLRVKPGMTKGEANEALKRFFKRNPATALAYWEERREQRRAYWASRKAEFVVLSNTRSKETNRLPAHPNQIGALMAAAWIRKDLTDGQRMEAKGMLAWGAGSAMVSEFLGMLPKQNRSAPAEQPN